MNLFLRVESAEVSLLGGREENQDRVSTAVAEHAALLVVVDGMGGHADGARAAQVTQTVITEAFWHTPQPLFDPLGFLHLALGRAHEEVVKLGTQLPLEQRPRATCAVCLVQQRASWWAHVGDSRIYHMRAGAARQPQPRPQPRGAAAARRPDQRRAGAQSPHAQLRRMLPRRRPDPAGDVARAPPRDRAERCAAGVHRWPVGRAEGRGDRHARWATPGLLREKLVKLGERAVKRAGNGSDNTSAAALRWLGE